MTFEKLLDLYLDGVTEGQSTLGNKPGHLKIVNNKLYITTQQSFRELKMDIY